MKKLFYVFNITVLFCFFSCSYNGKLLDTKEKVLARVDLPLKSYKLKIIYQPSNATIQSSIQIRKVGNDNIEKLLRNYERYNFLEGYKLINDTIFMIVLRDTVSYLGNHPDTMFVNLIK